MIFNKLKISAFGPFKDEITIDFSNLNKAGLFLITGPTGVGKTSIFDAISFALYGEISGFTGVLDKVRSHYAPNTQLTYVELSFTLGSKTCFIRREPSQLKLGKFDKEVMHPHTAYLEYDDVKIVGPNQVSKKIYELIGLNADLFRQVVMIPQGEFIKLLNSSSEDKGEIFRQIFNTKIILDFQDNIYVLAKEKKEQIDSYISNIKTRISEIDSKYENIINEEYVNYDDIFTSIANEVLNLDNLLKDNKLIYDGLVALKKEKEIEYNNILTDNKNIMLLKEKRTELDTLLKDELIEGYKDIVSHREDTLNLIRIENSLNDISKEIDLINNEREEALIKEKKNKELSEFLDEEENNLENLKHEIEEKRDEIVSLKMELDNSSKKEEIISSLKESENELKNVEESLSILSDDYLTIIDKIESINTEYESLTSRKNDGISLYQSKDKFSTELVVLNKLKDKFDRLNEIGNIIKNNESKMDELREENMQLLAKKSNIEYQLKINLASELSKNLPENAPCPVCGSLHHPKLATHKDSINDSELEAIRKRIIETSLTYDSLLKETSSLKKERLLLSEELEDDSDVSRFNASYDNIDELISSHTKLIEMTILEIENIKLLEENIRIKKEEKEEAIKLEDENKKKTEELSKEKSVLDSKIVGYTAKLELVNKARELHEINEEINKNTNLINDFETRYDNHKQRRIESLKTSYEIVTLLTSKKELLIANEEKKKSLLRDFEDFVSKFSSYEEYKNYSTVNYEEISNYVSNYQNSLLLINEKINELNTLTLNKEYQEANSNCIEEIEIKVNEAHTVLVSLMNKKENMSTKLEKIKCDYSKIEIKVKEYETIYRLARIANGYNDSKMPFEKYILSIYFLDILEYANKLLEHMSKNRYQLVRKESLGKGNSKQGLDIEVYDYNTGKLRDVKTLSGGEAFKAALCLALGLSEVIRRNSSLIPINTLFIDEGFGSLDPESLDIALNLLSNMKDSSRVIGIISHVGELKNRIDSQIVLSDKNGCSSIEIKGL